MILSYWRAADHYHSYSVLKPGQICIDTHVASFSLLCISPDTSSLEMLAKAGLE